MYRSLRGDVYSKAVDITMKIMSEEQYNELLKAYTKEALASMIKADIRNRFPKPYAIRKQSLRAVLRTLIKIYTFAPNFKFGTK